MGLTAKIGLSLLALITGFISFYILSLIMGFIIGFLGQAQNVGLVTGSILYRLLGLLVIFGLPGFLIFKIWSQKSSSSTQNSKALL